jgi:hypothetical protein
LFLEELVFVVVSSSITTPSNEEFDVDELFEAGSSVVGNAVTIISKV